VCLGCLAKPNSIDIHHMYISTQVFASDRKHGGTILLSLQQYFNQEVNIILLLLHILVH